MALAGLYIKRLEGSCGVGWVKMSRMGARRAAHGAFGELFRVGDAQMSRIGDREAVVPREKPPHPYSPVGGFMFKN